MAKQLFDEMLYVPSRPPNTGDVEDLKRYLYEELNIISGLLEAAVNGDVQGLETTTFVTADGTPKTMTVTNGVITGET